MHRITPGRAWALHDSALTRQIESDASAGLAAHGLMQRAGLASAQLALALAPHARTVWIACGPGNNGGDGFEAALHLQRWGKNPVITRFSTDHAMPTDAAHALQGALDAGVTFADAPPKLGSQDLCIDALLGLGQQRPVQGPLAIGVAQLNAAAAPTLALDLPTGLCADTGRLLNTGADPLVVQAAHTLSLLTLKPGLFTASGRDHAGHIWFDGLGASSAGHAASAHLLVAGAALCASHSSHKGSRGSVWIFGGAPGMRGAARLAAHAALYAGVGKVHLRWIDQASDADDPAQPELLFPRDDAGLRPGMTVLCGCGGGDLVAPLLPKLLAHDGPLVLDADALNAVARDSALQALLSARGRRLRATVLTPHPLEAARLLGCSLQAIQSDRLGAARQLAQGFACTVILKGSGSVLAAPDGALWINPTGNGRLAQAGTGDVLAGMVAAELALGRSPTLAAGTAVFRHGAVADRWPRTEALTADALARANGAA